MVTAVLAAMAVAILSATAYTVSNHDVESSGVDRQRVQAIGAAEAGINRTYLTVEGTLSGLMPCGTVFADQTMKTSPAAKYTVTIRYFSTNDGTGDIACVGTPPVPASPPASMLVTSVGTDRTTSRKMESLVRLTIGPGGAFGNDAIYADTAAEFNGQTNVYGTPDNGDVWANDQLRLLGGGTINGAVRSQQTITLGGGTQVKRDVFARDNVDIHGGSIAWANVNSSLGSIAVSGSDSEIKGDANACTGISNSGTIGGEQNPGACPPLLPSRQFSYYTYHPSHWFKDLNGNGTQDVGEPSYTVMNYDSTQCVQARNFIRSGPTGNYVVRISPACDLQFNNTVIRLRGDLAIITDGSITLNGSSRFESADTTQRQLALMSGIGGTAGSCTNDISLRGGTYTYVDVLLYSPCTIRNTAGALVVTGQIYAGRVDFNAGAALTFKGFVIPGLSTSYYNQDIAYIREIKD